MRGKEDNIEYVLNDDDSITPIRIIPRECAHPLKRHLGWSYEPYSVYPERYKDGWSFRYQIFECEICGLNYHKFRELHIKEEIFFVDPTERQGEIKSARLFPVEYKKARRTAEQMQISSSLFPFLNSNPNIFAFRTSTEVEGK